MIPNVILSHPRERQKQFKKNFHHGKERLFLTFDGYIVVVDGNIFGKGF